MLDLHVVFTELDFEYAGLRRIYVRVLGVLYKLKYETGASCENYLRNKVKRIYEVVSNASALTTLNLFPNFFDLESSVHVASSKSDSVA